MTSPLDRLRNPAHTGERRCWPCTAVNAALLVAGCVALARRRSRSLATALGLGGAAVIALRGYLVPYTPRFAPRLVSWLPGDPFHARAEQGARVEAERSGVPDRSVTDPTDPTDRSERSATDAPDASGSLGGGTDGATGEEVLAALLDRGVVTADGETVYLADSFRAAWREQVRDLRERDDDGLAAALRDVAPEGTVVDVVEQGGGPFRESETWFVVSDGSDDPASERWLTRPVALAEAGAVRTLADRTDLDATRRAAAAGPLRTFLESCPVCDGPVAETTTVECCGGPGGASADAPDEVLACEDCDERLYTFR